MSNINFAFLQKHQNRILHFCKTFVEVYFNIFFFTSIFQFCDIIALHGLKCGNFNTKKLQLSCDGVSESKSSNISLDVYSIKFENCRTIYPLRIIRNLKKLTVDHDHHFGLVLNDLNFNDARIMQFLGDNPKRSNARKCLCFSSWYPCEYCFCKGSKVVKNNAENEKKKKELEIQSKIVKDRLELLKQNPSENKKEIATLNKIAKDLNDAAKKIRPVKTNIVWPKTTANGPPRTREKLFEIIQKIENDQPLSIDEAKGVAGRSLLFDIPYFNFVMDIPVDYLHCTCLGVVKRCLELTFRVGENRSRITKRQLSSPLQFNLLIHFIKVVKEFNRRVRDLDLAVYKGQEYRNLVLFFFPIVLKCIEPNQKERHMWLYLAYAVKSCVVPTEEFRPIPLRVIDFCTERFYSLYQSLFGVANCTYNTHIFGSHLIEMRFHGPLTLTSTYPFESFYGELRNAFVPGTVSDLKQMFSNVLMKRALANHKCKEDIYISEKDTPMECNSIIYTFSNAEYNIFKVIACEDNEYLCHEIKLKNCTFPETPTLNWSLIGVFQEDSICDEEKKIPKKNVKGKVLLVDGYLITCPSNILREK